MKNVLLKLGLFLEYIILAIWLVVGLPMTIFLIAFGEPGTCKYLCVNSSNSEYILSSIMLTLYYIILTAMFIEIIVLTHQVIRKKSISFKPLLISVCILLTLVFTQALVIYFR